MKTPIQSRKASHYLGKVVRLGVMRKSLIYKESHHLTTYYVEREEQRTHAPYAHWGFFKIAVRW
jgi:hypothetical protein